MLEMFKWILETLLAVVLGSCVVVRVISCETTWSFWALMFRLEMEVSDISSNRIKAAFSVNCSFRSLKTRMIEITVEDATAESVCFPCGFFQWPSYLTHLLKLFEWFLALLTVRVHLIKFYLGCHQLGAIDVRTLNCTVTWDRGLSFCGSAETVIIRSNADQDVVDSLVLPAIPDLSIALDLASVAMWNKGRKLVDFEHLKLRIACLQGTFQSVLDFRHLRADGLTILPSARPLLSVMRLRTGLLSGVVNPVVLAVHPNDADSGDTWRLTQQLASCAFAALCASGFILEGTCPTIVLNSQL